MGIIAVQSPAARGRAGSLVGGDVTGLGTARHGNGHQMQGQHTAAEGISIATTQGGPTVVLFDSLRFIPSFVPIRSVPAAARRSTIINNTMLHTMPNGVYVCCVLCGSVVP